MAQGDVEQPVIGDGAAAVAAFPGRGGNTLRARRNEAPLEKLGSPASLDEWFRESGLVADDLGSGPEADLLKECGRPECTQVCLDRSRGFRREWCAMATCGNRVKAAAYRSRKRKHSLDS